MTIFWTSLRDPKLTNSIVLLSLSAISAIASPVAFAHISRVTPPAPIPIDPLLSTQKMIGPRPNDSRHRISYVSNRRVATFS